MSDERIVFLRNGFCTLAVACFLAGWRGWIPWWLGIALCLPLLLAAAAVVLMVEKRFREYIYERLALADLPSEAIGFFRQTSAALEALGFEPIGDYCLLPDPVPRHARIYSGPDGQCFACTYTNSAGTSRVNYLAYCSVTADGTYLESASYGGKYSLDPDVPLRFQYLDEAVSTAEALRQHLEFVERHAHEAQTGVLRFRPEQFRQVLDYGHRLSRWEEYRAANHDAPAPPEGEAMESGALVAAGER